MASRNDLSQYNLKNSAVKRILQEVKELRKEGCKEFIGEPVQDNIFEWHFAIRGPDDSEFEGGIYHGRILLPPDYPFKPPTFMMLTPNGRFEVNTKICLSISQHHPEHWQPSWSVRTALVALRAFMPTPGDGAIGSLDYPKEERVILARKSHSTPPTHGGPDRQQLIQEVHDAMLAAYDLHREEQAAARAGREAEGGAEVAAASSTEATAAQGGAEAESGDGSKEAATGGGAGGAPEGGAEGAPGAEGTPAPGPPGLTVEAPAAAIAVGATGDSGEGAVGGDGGASPAPPSPAPLGSPLSGMGSAAGLATPTTPVAAPATPAPAATPSPGPPPLSPAATPYSSQARVPVGPSPTEAEERRLSMIAAALVAAIVAILWRRLAITLGYTL